MGQNVLQMTAMELARLPVDGDAEAALDEILQEQVRTKAVLVPERRARRGRVQELVQGLAGGTGGERERERFIECACVEPKFGFGEKEFCNAGHGEWVGEVLNRKTHRGGAGLVRSQSSHSAAWRRPHFARA